jgi:hypothetical protein
MMRLFSIALDTYIKSILLSSAPYYPVHFTAHIITFDQLSSLCSWLCCTVREVHWVLVTDFNWLHCCSCAAEMLCTFSYFVKKLSSFHFPSSIHWSLTPPLSDTDWGLLEGSLPVCWPYCHLTCPVWFLLQDQSAKVWQRSCVLPLHCWAYHQWLCSRVVPH